MTWLVVALVVAVVLAWLLTVDRIDRIERMRRAFRDRPRGVRTPDRCSRCGAQMIVIRGAARCSAECYKDRDE